MLPKKSTLAALLGAIVIAGTSAAPAFAGEVTGNGKPTAAPKNANSICVFSGQNDTPDAEGPEGGRTQSYGQLVRGGYLTPQITTPGQECRGGSNVGEP